MPVRPPVEVGTAFAAALKAKVPALAPHIDAILAQPAALEELGRGALMREDHSTLMNDAAAQKKAADDLLVQLQETKRKQDEWWNKSQDEVELGRKAKAANWKPGDPDPNADPNADPTRTAPKGLTREDVEKLANDREVAQAMFVTTLTDLSMKHYQRFGQVLDTNALTQELMKDPAARERGLEGHYRFKYNDQLKAAEQKAADEDFDRRYKERRSKEISAPPYPVSGTSEAGSPLDALETTKPNPNAAGVDEAVRMYTELVSSGGAR